LKHTYPGKIQGQVLLSAPKGKWPRNGPRTRSRNNVADLVWSRLGVKPAEVYEIAEDVEVRRFLRWLLPPQQHPEEKCV